MTDEDFGPPLTDWSQWKPPGIDPCRYGYNTFFKCPREDCLCARDNRERGDRDD